MDRRLWAGLDVGGDAASLCVIDHRGTVLQETSCSSDIGEVHAHLCWLKRRRQAIIGIEAGTGTHLARALRSLGYTVEIYETLALSKFLRARRNKSDSGDANGIAEAGRIGATVVPKVYLKSLDDQALQARLTLRRHLIRERVAAINLLNRQISLFGGRPLGRAPHREPSLRRWQAHGEAELRALFGRPCPPLADELQRLICHCAALLREQARIDAALATLATDLDVVRRLMTVPGVGPICALTFASAVGDPARFPRVADIGPYLGLTPRLHQSGKTSRSGAISRRGSAPLRTLLVHAAMIIMQARDEHSELAGWANAVRERRGPGRARVALARKLAVTLLTMWKSGQDYRPSVCPSRTGGADAACSSAPTREGFDGDGPPDRAVHAESGTTAAASPKSQQRQGSCRAARLEAPKAAPAPEAPARLAATIPRAPLRRQGIVPSGAQAAPSPGAERGISLSRRSR